MSEKKRTSITVDPDVYEFLSQSQINQSGLINELVQEYKDNHDRQVASLELRYQHLIQEAQEAEQEAKTKREQAKEVKELLEDARNSEREGIKEARAALEGTPREPDNPAVKTWAEKLGLTPEQLLRELSD